MFPYFSENKKSPNLTTLHSLFFFFSNKIYYLCKGTLNPGGEMVDTLVSGTSDREVV